MESPLQNENRVVRWIAELTRRPEDTVRRRLRDEFDNPGSTVARALRESGIEPYVWSDALARFYEQTDAFLYELVIWNLNAVKEAMWQAAARQLTQGRDGPQDILTIGDGLGMDSARLAAAGHRVTYFELTGYSESFARHVFTATGVDVTVRTNPDEIPPAAFDAVVCLDVLEHVPDPPAFVGRLADYLRPGGRLLVHAPFMMVYPATATHLKSNRRYSGSLSLYRRHRLDLLDGAIAWNPITFQKPGGPQSPPSIFSPKRLLLRLAGCAMLIGRWTVLPFVWADALRRHNGRWFSE